jgi:heme exporter protein A
LWRWSLAALELVEVVKVAKTFGATLALRGVDAVFRPGLTLVEGSNGSGKSTLLGIISMAIRPTSGEILVEPGGLDQEEIRAEVGWLSHELLAYPDLTGRQNIELTARIRGLDPGAAWKWACSKVGIGRFGERPLRTNSRGQRQRIALARALVHRPSLVLLDEPTTGLDEAGVGMLLGLVRRLCRRGAIVLAVSHNPELFESINHQTLVLDGGRVVGGDSSIELPD